MKKDLISSLKVLWRPLVLILAVTFLFLYVWLSGAATSLLDLKEWIASFGLLAPVVFFCIYLGATLAAFPGTILGVLAGTLFGAVVGVITVSISSTISAAVAFLIARYGARNSIEKWASSSQRIAELDELFQKYGWLVVAITRLIPLFPFNLLNYALGLTGVSFMSYIWWSWLCMLPWSILVVVGTDVIVTAASQGIIMWELIVILLVAILILAGISWQLKKMLAKGGKGV